MPKILVIMDPPSTIKPYKDTTVAMLLEAQHRDYQCFIAETEQLWLDNSDAWVAAHPIEVRDAHDDWYSLQNQTTLPLTHFDIILMRKDPPFDMQYIYTTYILEMAERKGVMVVNKPQALRDANEKLAALWFPEWVPSTLVSGQAEQLREFINQQGRCVLKPLDGMGGRSIFMTDAKDPNLNVIIETLTQEGNERIMAQGYLEAIKDGDLRVLLVAGKPVPYMLARIPGKDDFRGNLARGGRGEPRPLGRVERELAESIGPELLKRGILFAGIDIIGGKLTEVNVTSPTCVRELDQAYGINICADLFDAIEQQQTV